MVIEMKVRAAARTAPIQERQLEVAISVEPLQLDAVRARRLAGCQSSGVPAVTCDESTGDASKHHVGYGERHG